MLAFLGPSAAAAPKAAPTGEPADAREAVGDIELARLEEAKRLFRRGNELRQVGDFEHALTHYLRSRALVPSMPNTYNAAICLGELGRDDEALDVYEALLAEFSDELDARRRQDVKAEVRRLRGLVGRLAVQANTDATLLVDGRVRGRLPLSTAVHVTAGERTVRVVRAGYEGFETRVRIRAGQLESLVAALVPLPTVGRALVDEPRLAGAQVFVDGLPAGELPWEGALAPGEHTWHVELGGVGSAPASVVVVAGQLVRLSPKVSPLGAELLIEVTPSTAGLLIDGVPVGKGSWSGRLPLGAYEITAREEGYRARASRLQVTEQEPQDLRLVLEADDTHPRWAAPTQGTFWLEALGGLALAPTLGSDAESWCSRGACTDDGWAVGMLIGARGGYEFPFRVSLELAAGYLTVSKTLSRAIDDSFQVGSTLVSTRYALTDELWLGGPWVAAGIGYRLPFAELLQLRGHLLVGAHVTYASDAIAGTATDGSSSAAVGIAGSGDSVSAGNLLVMPEVHFGVLLGGFSASLGLSGVLLALDGPALETGDLTVQDGACEPTAPGIGCAPGEGIVAGERAYGTHWMLVPSLAAGYRF